MQSALFENNMFLVAQHMMQFAATGKRADPMPSRISAWAVYDVFTVKDGEQIFLAVVERQAVGHLLQGLRLEELLADPRLKTNNDRVLAREWMMPMLRSHLAGPQRGRTQRGVRAERAALRAHHPAAGAVRRPAPERHRRPGAGRA